MRWARVGFLNPWLYGQGLTDSNDVTSGFDPRFKTDGGWDPICPMGKGTPDFEKRIINHEFEHESESGSSEGER